MKTSPEKKRRNHERRPLASGGNPDETLTSREVMERLKLSEDQMFVLRQKGMPCIKVNCHQYRYRWAEVCDFLNAPRVPIAERENPFVVEPWKHRAYRFRVRGTGEFSDEERPFTSERNAIAFAATRNRAVRLRGVAPIPRHQRGADPDGPFCTVSPLRLAARPELRFRAYYYLTGQKHAKEWHFRTEAEALQFANRKNLEFERERVAREVEKLPVPKLTTGEVPPLDWTPDQMEGIDRRHGSNPVKGPPFRIHTTTQEGYSFVVTGPKIGSYPKRSYFRTEREAKTYAHLRNTEAQSQGFESLTFPTWLRVAAQSCHERLAKHGKTLEDATRHFLDYLERTQKSVPLSQLVKECLLAKKNAGFSHGWQYLLRHGLTPFREHFGEKTSSSEITTQQIAKYILETKPHSPSARNALRMQLWTLFSYAKKVGYVEKNPVDGTIPEKVIVAPVGIFKPEQVAALLDAVPIDWLPFLAIGAFAGLRTEELKRLDWAQVDLADGYIEVTAKNAKSARRRLVKILPALDAFIRPLAKKFGPVCPCKGFLPTSHIAATMRKAGIEKWPKNAMRHSFASYHIAHFKDAAALALELGHTTTALIFQHYRQVVRSADGERWWALRPARDDLNRIVHMPPSAEAVNG